MSESEEIKRPSLTLKVGGRAIKMTYGLQMDIQRMLPDPQAAMNLVLSDPFTQDYIIRRVLTDKNEMITQVDQLVPMDQVDLDMDQIEDLLQWVVDHVLYFFVSRSSRLQVTAEKYKSVLQDRSTTGSPSLASTTPSAGPSE